MRTGVIFKIALRNLQQHKVKTAIIGILISLAIMLMVVGNSMMDTVTANMQKTYRGSYTGDLIIHGKTDPGISLFGAAGPAGINTTVPTIDSWQTVGAQLDSMGLKWMAQTSAMGLYQNGEDPAGVGFFWGITPDRYKQVFSNHMTLREGRFLEEGDEDSIALSVHRAEALEEETGIPIHAGDKVTVMGFSASSGIRIRELLVVGLFEFKNGNEFLNTVSFVDPISIMEIGGISTSSVTWEDLSTLEKASLERTKDDELFGESLVVEEVVETDFSNFSLADDPFSTVVAEEAPQAWQFIVVRVPEGSSVETYKAQLNQYFTEQKMELFVDGWRWGAGFTAEIAYVMQAILNVVIFIISVVAMIIIMNTLVISLTERIGEIGTIRAIGGQKSFIRGLITWETLTTTGIFGIAGILLGMGVLLLINLLGISSDNEFFVLLFGGNTLSPQLSLGSLVASMFTVTIIGLVSSLYPVALAMKIQPVVAMQR